MRRITAVLLFLSALSAHAGETITPEALKPYAGRVVYVDFWASWCAPCAQSFPWLNDMQAKYGSKLTVVGVNVDTSEADAQRFLTRHPARFEILRDPQGKLAEHYKIQGMPSAIILDGQGRVMHQHSGFRSSEAAEYEAFIRKALSTDAADSRS